jgi:hypothetical protein
MNPSPISEAVNWPSWPAKADNSDRQIRVRQGQTIRGTFDLDAPSTSDSRQVRRFKVRTAAFNELSRYNLPRAVRRKAAINARLEAK